jgi:hypothetical protein
MDITVLWLPIVVASVAVFVLSSIVNMAMPWHKKDYPALPDQDRVLDALRPFNLMPGDYVVPRPATRSEFNTPEFTAKLERGPVLVLTVAPNGRSNMGLTMGEWFVYLLVVNCLVALVALPAVHSATEQGRIMHFVGLASFLAYVVALWQMSIWFRRAWRTTIWLTVDGLIYGIATGLIFCWLWPR